MKKTPAALAVLLLVFLTAVGIAVGANHAETYKLRATLNAGQEIPKQTFKDTRGSGHFTGTLTERAASSELTWRLTFKNLSGSAAQAHIHTGRTGHSGPIAIPLCAPCRSGAHGTARVTSTMRAEFLRGGTYVNVHTAKNPNGEIRGQIKSSTSY